VRVHRSPQLSQEIEELRRVGFPQNYSGEVSTRDRFDERSTNIHVTVDGAVAACGRLTRGPDAVFGTWSRSAGTFPRDQSTGDVNRCIVAPPYRGLGLFELVVIEALLVAHELGCQWAVGATARRRPFPVWLARLGFQPGDSPLHLHEPGAVVFVAEMLVVAVSGRAESWRARREHLLETLRGSAPAVAP
jgi:hypothetical protein